MPVLCCGYLTRQPTKRLLGSCFRAARLSPRGYPRPAGLTAACWVAEVTAAPVYDIDQFLADPHVLAREIVVDVPDKETGQITMHNIIPRLSETPGRLRTPAPRIGEHTADILGQFGIARETLEALAAEGIVGLDEV